MFDFHAHPGLENSSAFISILKKEELFDISPYSSIGLLSWNDKIEKETIEELVKSNKSLMLGEAGLDKTKGRIDEQIDDFRFILSLSKEYDRLVVIHSVRSNSLVLKELRDFKIKRALFHSYTSSFEEAKEIERNGYLISLGPRSFKTRDIRELLTLNFTLESDMATGVEQKEVLKGLYEKAEMMTNLDIEKIMHDRWNMIWDENFYA